MIHALRAGAFVLAIGFSFLSGAAAFPRGIFVSGPPASARSTSVLPSLAGKDFVAGYLVRIDWASLEPEEGRCDMALLDRELAAARAVGKQVALAVVNGAHVPPWLWDRGAASVQVPVRGRGVQRIALPWDEVYLAAWCRFVGQLGKHAASHPSLVLVHITHATLNGFEMQLAFSPTEEAAWREAGYTAAKHLASWQRVVATFGAAFPTLPLDVEVHPVLGDDAIARGVVAFGRRELGERFGVFGAWWSPRNAEVYAGMFALLQEAAAARRGTAQLVASETPNRWNPRGGLGEGGLGKALDFGLEKGLRYFEVWETDLLNAGLEAKMTEVAKRCGEP
ncbi:MAG: beta-galactosidase [Spirochaetes bacterium]|nr:beta-galactosidase [Spirochaetota bacterium]